MDTRKNRRTAFFESTNHSSYKLTASNVSDLASIYSDKYKIKILMNGATEFGKRLIQEKIKHPIDTIDFFRHRMTVESTIRSMKEKSNEDEKIDINQMIIEFKILHDTYLELSKDCVFFMPYPKEINALINLLSRDNIQFDEVELADYAILQISLKSLSILYKNLLPSEEKNQLLKSKIAEIIMNIDSTEHENEFSEMATKDFYSYHESIKDLITSIMEDPDEENWNVKDLINEFIILHDTYLELAKECSIFFKPYPKEINKLIESLKQIDSESVSGNGEDANLFPYIDQMKIFKNTSDDYKVLLKEKNLLLKRKITETETAYQEMMDKDDTALTKEEAINEINEIKKSLKDDEAIGYVFTNNHRFEGGHFEVLIITNNLIIKPCEWGVFDSQAIRGCDMDDFSSLEMPFARNENLACFFPIAQAGTVECGTLGMLNLKELLKDNANQLRNLTMHVPFYDHNEKLHHFFFPSPHVLRYSQSSTFNKIILGMLADQLDPIKIPFKQRGNKDTVTAISLVAMLKNTISIAEKNGDKNMLKICQRLLDKLPTFRDEWLENYNLAMVKRDAMQINTRNEYLSYSSQRLTYKVIDHLQEEADNNNRMKKNK